MASSKVMTRKSDLPTPRSSSSSSSSLSSSSPAKSLDQTTPTTTDSSLLLDAQITLIETPNPVPISKTVDEVWREIVSGERKVCKQEQHDDDEMMTLEDFLVKAGAVQDQDQDQDENEEDVKMMKEEHLGGASILAFPNNNNHGSARVGKRPRVLEPLDRAAQQRQRRMIKNRESAARSRERKQAYQNELESLAVRLEEENGLLLKDKAEKTKERFKQVLPLLFTSWKKLYQLWRIEGHHVSSEEFAPCSGRFYMLEVWNEKETPFTDIGV
ncbi:G-box-binding factor 4-like isoform X1 [Quercus lobata]|uniref:G-box-binding factor 4-like isoform X1 n=1 Tax=Quercus lobata TaxID=97700 RepID=UPI001247BA50|nr:G-box-binding factor 4-like isoform X1 [Quercus lobata]